MPGCSAYGCSNRADQGFQVFRFPTDPERRKIWGDKVNRKGWEPTTTSVLCEIHFEQDQLENRRADGKRKLRWNAIPTIFNHLKIPKRRRPLKGSCPETQNKNNLLDHTYCHFQENDNALSASEAEDGGHKCTEDNNTQDGRSKSELISKLTELKKELLKVRKQNGSLLKAKARQEGRISRLFNPDQFQALSRLHMKGVYWSSPTVKKALQLRFACGESAYRVLLRQQYPLPSEIILQRRLCNIPFEPGVLTNIFDMLEMKVKEFSDEEKICCLTLSEMTLAAGVEHDAASKHPLGSVTLPQHTGSVNCALVFTLGGITTCWKQTVAYHYTNSQTDGNTLKNIILDIIHQAADINLHVESVLCDMGAFSQAMWRSFGVTCGKDCKTINKVTHPEAPDRWLYFLADVPRVFRSIKSSIIWGDTITLSDKEVEKHHLLSSTVSVKPLNDLAEFQEDLELKVAPKLTVSSLVPEEFDKMKLSCVTQVLSHEVSCGLKYLVEKEGRKEEYLTTAWLLEVLSRWFQLMTSRHPVLAICKLDPRKYDETLTFLRDVIQIFSDMKIGEEGDWEPFQTGVIISTSSVIEIAEEVLDADHKFLLTSRVTQDCLEDLFSLNGLQEPVSSLLDFKHALKTISIAQFLALPSSGSYEKDDGEILSEFVAKAKRVPVRLKKTS